MEFRFDLNQFLQEPLVELNNTLIPPGFTGDKRSLWDVQSKITQIVNAMGEASAQAQGLSKQITTADKLRNSEHKLYLLIDQTANSGKGAVTGMLKTGEKGLYIFDREGQHHQVTPICVLDFYVHESRQRSGFGRKLFEHMLKMEQVEPVKLAIDRPSDKFLGFLNKHYGLNNPIKQMNNYVVFDGFFPKVVDSPKSTGSDPSHSPRNKSANSLQQGYPTSPYGRYAAPRPPCSMGQIIHNDSPVIKRNAETAGQKPTTSQASKADRPQSLNLEVTEMLQPVENVVKNGNGEETLDGKVDDDVDILDGEEEVITLDEIKDEVENLEEAALHRTPMSKSPVIEAAGIVTPGRNTPGLTEQGYFDLKFYHNKLW
ncbi:alpha-tubulin N-acetyltransferase-like [Rhynchophorus ferrugineus]|uniref:alpha-tubulin N-acetyltransferase-like n=1 Tax=Rhynchophorus ferrugineus TaxID=354439 RepID=UPI003FCD3193